MDEIKIANALPQEEGEPQQPKSDGKNIVIALLVLVGIFIVVFGGFKIYNHITAADVINIDDLHEQNIEGNLNEEEGYMYNGFSFVKADGLWWTEVVALGRLVKIPLHFGPKELEDIEITGSLSGEFDKGDTVYMAIDPNVVSGHYVVAMTELSSNIAQGIGRNSKGACTENHTGCEERKILSCDNTQGLPVIELYESETTGIKFMGNCVKISGQDYDIIRAANRLIYKWYGIMD